VSTHHDLGKFGLFRFRQPPRKHITTVAHLSGSRARGHEGGLRQLHNLVATFSLPHFAKASQCVHALLGLRGCPLFQSAWGLFGPSARPRSQLLNDVACLSELEFGLSLGTVFSPRMCQEQSVPLGTVRSVANRQTTPAEDSGQEGRQHTHPHPMSPRKGGEPTKESTRCPWYPRNTPQKNNAYNCEKGQRPLHNEVPHAIRWATLGKAQSSRP
jgi:hypothetical protein